MAPPVNPQAFQFRDRFYDLPVPPWLRTGNGEKYVYTLELCRDLLCEKAYQAMTIRLPGVGDESNIPFLAFDRNLTQGIGESNEACLVRLQHAFAAWGKSGSAPSIIDQLQAYLQNLQPGVNPAYPLVTIVNNGSFTGSNSHTTWTQVYQGTPIGDPPTVTTSRPSNFDWDTELLTWRNWLVLPMALVDVPGLSGAAAASSTAAPSACFTNPGQNVDGVWVPATSGTPVNSPWLTLTGMTGLTAAQVGQWVTISGSANPGNNGTFQIVSVTSSSICVIANPAGVPADAGPLTWVVGQYPFIGPGPAWGAPGYVFGQGELVPPPVDTGSNIQGVWQPLTAPGAGAVPSISWGLDVGSDVLGSIRGIVKTWKSAATYYANIVLAFDCGDGTAGSAYSPNSTPGGGNPDGTFGSVGKLVDGVWVPSRLITSPWDCYCQGTGSYDNCTVENVS